jgi:hypothetical protein
VLAVIGVAQVMVFVATTIVNIALPIGDLDFSTAGVDG